jgi:hypothetical protein
VLGVFCFHGALRWMLRFGRRFVSTEKPRFSRRRRYKTLLKHDSLLQFIWTQLQPLLQPRPVPLRCKIGFQ